MLKYGLFTFALLCSAVTATAQDSLCKQPDMVVNLTQEQLRSLNPIEIMTGARFNRENDGGFSVKNVLTPVEYLQLQDDDVITGSSEGPVNDFIELLTVFGKIGDRSINCLVVKRNVKTIAIQYRFPNENLVPQGR